MAAVESVRPHPSTATGNTRDRRIFAVLAGLAGLAVLLQGLWAGLFLQYGEDQRAARLGWLNVHARGGEVAVALALLATVWALLRLRSRRDLVIGAGVLTVLLGGIAYVGGLISDDGKDFLIPLHIPLALTALVLAASLPVLALRRRGLPG